MKFGTNLMIIFSLILMVNNNSFSEKKNAPDDDVIETALTNAGNEHYPEKFKFDEIGSIEYEDTYYHSYIGYNKDGTYRVLFFNNTSDYLGYYTVEFEPIDYEKGAVLLDDGADGNYYIRLGKNGPPENILIDGIKITFKKNKKIESKKETIINNVVEKPVIAYRIWTIKRGGKIHNPECIFVKKVGSKVYLKEKTRGKTVPFSDRELSKEDILYLEAIGEI